MTSQVTIQSHLPEPVALPPLCCYCLEPATTTHPVRVFFAKLSIATHTKLSSHDELPMPYCATQAWPPIPTTAVRAR
jgi:hypothetical protein